MNGQQYGLPVRAGGDANTIFYRNVDLFNAGLNAGKPPETLDQLLRRLKLVRYDATDLSSCHQGAWQTGDYNNVARLYAANGVSLKTYGTSFTRVLRWRWLKLSRSTCRGIAAQVMCVQVASISTARRRCTKQVPGVVVHREPRASTSLGPRPRLNASVPYAGAHIGTWHYVIPKGSHADEAWLLLRWLGTRRDTIGDFLLRQGRLAPLVAFNSNPEYRKINKDILALANAMSMAASVQMLPISRQLMDIHASALTDVVYGRKGSVVAWRRRDELFSPFSMSIGIASECSDQRMMGAST